MLQLRHLSKEYRAGKPVLTDINLEIATRGITAILGPSGAGKSTLIRCINRSVEPTAGEILFEGQDLAKLEGRLLRDARRDIGMVIHEDDLVARLTLIENLLSGRLGRMSLWRAWRRKFPANDVCKAIEVLDVVGLREFAHRRADALTATQRQRVGIARAVMREPKLLLADEPTSSLDSKTAVEIMDLFRRVTATCAIPMLIGMHNVALARRFADRVVAMAEGKVVYDGPPAYLTDDVLTQIYGGEDWHE